MAVTDDSFGQAVGQTSFQIEFYRTILNGNGAVFKSTIDSIGIRSARSPERAVKAAQRRFERKFRLRCWDHLAHGFLGK